VWERLSSRDHLGRIESYSRLESRSHNQKTNLSN
jgi:hypothetical protein